MQIASSASIAGGGGRSASQDAATASMPSGPQARRGRSAVSPRLAVRSPVRLRVRDDRLDAERPAGAQDPQRDLAAIGDEDPSHHQASSSRRRPSAAFAPLPPVTSISASSSPYSTASPVSANTSARIPSAG